MAQATRYNEPFYLHRIVNVGWGGSAVVLVEVTAAEIKAFSVESTDPTGVFPDHFAGTTVTEDDYKGIYVLELGSPEPTGAVVVEDEIDDIWIWDGRVTNPLGDDTGVAEGTALFGYPPNLHLVGQQVQLTLFGGAYGLGNVKSHTFPNGSSISYRSGYTVLNHGPQYDAFGQPYGDFSYADTESWYWYRVTTRPEQTAAVLRHSYLVNIRKDFVARAELQDFGGALDYPLTWSIAGYKAGTSFNVAAGHATPTGSPVPVPTFADAGSVAGAHSGVIRQFGSHGFV
jgi:hypothetical protein